MLAAGMLAGLAGCGGSDGHAGRPEFDPDYNRPSTGSYNGKVLDGYLRNALVWIDLNNDRIQNENEPSTETGPGGRFSFTAEQLADIARPNAYPLGVKVRAGVTVDEDTGLAVDRSYLLMAPPIPAYRERVVSPFSTIFMAEWQLPVTDEDGNYVPPTEQELASGLQTAVNGAMKKLGLSLNLGIDYVANDQPQLHIYAKALVRAMQDYITEKAGGNLDALSADEINALVRALANQGHWVIEAVDEAAGENPSRESYRALSLNAIPPVNLQVLIDDPYRLWRKRIYTHPDAVAIGGLILPALEGNPPYTSASGLTQEQTYAYDGRSRLREINVWGGLREWRRDLLLTHSMDLEAWFPAAWMFEQLPALRSDQQSVRVEIEYEDVADAEGTLRRTTLNLDTGGGAGAPDGVTDEVWSQEWRLGQNCAGIQSVPKLTGTLLDMPDDSCALLSAERWGSVDVRVEHVKDEALNRLTALRWTNPDGGAVGALEYGVLMASQQLVQVVQGADVVAELTLLYSEEGRVNTVQVRHSNSPDKQDYCLSYEYDDQQRLLYQILRPITMRSCDTSKAWMVIEHEYKRLTELLIR